MSLKDDVITLLTPIFGRNITQTINDNYDDDDSQEIYDVAHAMLVNFMGEKNANKKLSAIIHNYPKLKI